MEGLQTYEHRVQYYETDQMGIVHHSNYIRWFEEARVDLMRQMGMGYDKMEEMGIISPVLQVSAEYRSMVHFDEIVKVQILVKKFNGIILQLSYRVEDKETGELRCTGESKHCFLDPKGNPVSLKKTAPEVYESFCEISHK